MPRPALFFFDPLGAGNGPGFGWQNVDVWKLGVEYAFKSSEIAMACMHAARQSVTGSSLFNGLIPVPNAGGTEEIQMHQNSLGSAWG